MRALASGRFTYPSRRLLGTGPQEKDRIMADSQQEIDWTAIRLMALQCLSASWDLVWWAERSHEGDYDVKSAALHLAAIERAHDTLHRAVRTFSPGVAVLGRDFLCASAHFDAIAQASVGEGPRPDFRVGGTCCATAHQSAYVLLRTALIQFEGALLDDSIATRVDYLRTLSPEALRDTLIQVEKVTHFTGLFAGQSADVLEAWIDREWAAVSRAPAKAGQQLAAADEEPAQLPAAAAVAGAGASQLPDGSKAKGRGQGDKEKGQKRRPLNDESRKCLNQYNRLIDAGRAPESMAQHCRSFAEKNGGSSDSIYRTLKDYSELWHKPGNGDKAGDNDS